LDNPVKGGFAMPKKKSVSFDAMVKFFMQHYNIPTKKDVEKLIVKLERLESIISEASLNAGPKTSGSMVKPKFYPGRPGMTASDQVLEVIKAAKGGAGFSDIQNKTGFKEKKIRNIVFRLNKLQKIRRINRGVYTQA
jgi:hypothetical protein